MSPNRLDYYRQEVDDLIIEVQVRGVPTPKLVWSRDGVELDVENSEKFFVMREPDGIYKLCIHDPQKMDGGRFIIEASNKAGKEEIRRTIRFLGKEHYKYLPGIHHADPKQPHEREEGDEPFVEPEPEAPAAPESDEPEMVKEKVSRLLSRLHRLISGQMGQHQAEEGEENSFARESLPSAFGRRAGAGQFAAETGSSPHRIRVGIEERRRQSRLKGKAPLHRRRSKARLELVQGRRAFGIRSAENQEHIERKLRQYHVLGGVGEQRRRLQVRRFQ